MTPEEAVTLQEIGKDLRKTFAAIIVKTFLFPLYVVCFYKAINILRRKPRGWMTGINMTIMILLFLMASSLISIDISNFVTEINTTFIYNTGTVLDTKYGQASNATFNRVLVIDAVYTYMTVLGDAIIVWRVVIVWRVNAFWGQGKRRWALYILYAMLLGSTITAFLLNYCVASLGTDLFLGGFQHPLFCRNIQITSYAMPAATTFVATTLIGITFWEYHLTIKPDLPLASRSTQVGKLLLLLVESGFLYFAFFGCYPTLIIILAHSERTTLEKHSTVPSIHLIVADTSGHATSRPNRLVDTPLGTGTTHEEETELAISSQNGTEPNQKDKGGILPL
ncbi:hypothetical protein DXG01_004297 [Tephrocybe rancida]|nr:hypothetical protein DXG01_004297 [Tephrocybe rancida]